MERDPKTTSIIISDLHFGQNDDFDIFQANGKDAAFEAFLAHCGDTDRPVELIINGDFVDFLQLKPWDIYLNQGTKSIRQQALVKAQAIVQGNHRAFKALADFLAKPNARIVILLGNHDVELAYDEVWAVVEKAILAFGGQQNRLRLINRATQYNPGIGGVLVHIEHGNFGDPFNELNYTELFADAETNSGYHLPPGTRFVYEVMNQFKEHLRFVDLLKPEVPAVPLVLARLEPFRSVKLLPQAARDMMLALKNGLIRRVQQKAGGGSFGMTGRQPPEPGDALAEMARWYVEEVDTDPSHLVDLLKLDESDTAGAVAGPSFGPKWMPRLKNSFGDAILKCLGRPARLGDPGFYKTDQSVRDSELAQKKIRGDVQIVVFGHTHSALKREFTENTVYVNSGAWANLIELPSESSGFSAWLERIATNQFDRTSFPTYITLAPASGGANLSLAHWSAKGEQVLWSKTITASK